MFSILSSLQSTFQQFSIKMIDYVEQTSTSSSTCQILFDNVTLNMTVQETSNCESFEFQSIYTYNSILETIRHESTHDESIMAEVSVLDHDGSAQSDALADEVKRDGIISQDSQHNEILDDIVYELIAFVELNDDIKSVLNDLIDTISENIQIETVLDELLNQINDENEIDYVRGSLDLSLSFIANSLLNDTELLPLHNSSSNCTVSLFVPDDEDDEKRQMEMKIVELSKRIKQLENELEQHQQRSQKHDNSSICISEFLYDEDTYVVIDIA
ncbi:unnamed protein product [Didymodactylos carnosus]|uniref:Uncharacterized protein n=1 Tax=Didymodactylos carnosus TaxID=1234261 RepID=A0A8S2GJH2_9BILA|nr:unnamed protein product [Didymodactylos carnosus]CAF3526722.1 unnamed protein product [Didymodactylos carnosus]